MAKKSDIFKAAITDFVTPFIKDLGYSNPDRAPNTVRGRAFLNFYLKQIFSQFIDIDEDSLEIGQVDRKGDRGIDFIYISENNIYIVQSKYEKRIDTKTELTYFTELPINISKDKFYSDANADLKGFIDEIKLIKNPSFKLFFVTFAKIDDETIAHYEERESHLDVDYSILGFSQLGQEYRRVQSLDDLPPDEVKLNLGNEDYLHLGQITGHFDTILVTQQGSKIKGLYSQKNHKESLFNHNIRYWLGKNAVNKGMIDTIDEEPNNFLYYNNGITAITENMYIEDNYLICK